MTASLFSERVRRRLLDIVDDIDRLTGFVSGLDVDAFAADERTVLAVERLLQRITEAVVQIGVDQMAQLAPDMPVGKIGALGNRLRHDYGKVDPALPLMIACEDLPGLRAAAVAGLER